MRNKYPMLSIKDWPEEGKKRLKKEGWGEASRTA
jgi:hypothetical protein